MFDSAGLVQKRVTDGLVLCLRNTFVDHPVYPWYQLTNGDFDYTKSKIFITTTIPLAVSKYPMLIVESVPGEEQRFLGPDLYGDVIDPSIGGMTVTTTLNFTSIPLTATVKIYTRDPVTQDLLQSAVYDSLKTNKDVLAQNGVEIIQQRWGAPQREFIEDRWWIVVPLTMELIAEWSSATPIEFVVSKVNLTNVFTGSSTSEF